MFYVQPSGTRKEIIMKYSIRYSSGSAFLTSADEVIIKYDKINPNLIEYAANFVPKEQRLVIAADDTDVIVDSLDIFKATAAAHKNLAILLDYSQSPNVDYLLDELHLKYFYSKVADNFTTLEELAAKNPSDIRIGGDLGFFLGSISPYLREKGINIRVSVNAAAADDIKPEHKFFIRPEGVAAYEDLIDYIEFAGPIEQENTLCKIYKDKEWAGGLEMIIPSLGVQIDNRTIMPVFDTYRTDCKRKCAYNRCELCNNIFAVAKSLEEKNIGLKVVK